LTISRSSVFVDGVVGTAVFSDDDRHRYLLTRDAGADLYVKPTGFPLFIMLNPSTATHEQSDPTVTRCRRFAVRWGFLSFRVCNLFSLRATNPKELLRDDAPEGDPENLETILAMAAEANIVICAWGTMGELRQRRLAVTRALCEREAVKLRCFGRTKDGSPKHPLYLRSDTELWLYRPEVAGGVGGA
jgi:hypothetical protein